tara:strand:+ start:82 stop:327 length:246 start_codon:yes stop_codon:yes gene_type:complete
MNHKISEFCDKIDSIKKMADRLRVMKYGPVKADKSTIDNFIQTIQADCLLVANDKGEYVKEDDIGDFGVDHPSGLSIDQDE